jgi:hypothetical protein
MNSFANCTGSETSQPMPKRALIAVLIAAGSLVVVTVFYFFDPARGGLYPPCLLHQYTGLNCPGCGSLRALHHLTHGEFSAAFRCNPLLMVLLPWFAFTGVRWLVRGCSLIENDPLFLRPVAIWILLAVTLAFTVLRNLPGPAFAWMSP